jgi:predicted porin
MANKFNKTKLAAAIGVAAVSLGLSTAANAVVVVGGDNGWEVSFDGNVNAFYVNGNFDRGWHPLGYSAPQPVGGTGPHADGSGFVGADRDVARVTSGFLPAFFSFNVKSPTVDGMYATARFSFAPTINNSNTKNQLYAPGGINVPGATNNGIQGASIDTREVLVNINAPVGTLSFGRTLSIYGRNAILKDMTLFGVGIANVNSGTVTAGRIGRGYTYPNFNARISYKTPVMSGFQAEVGLYDPSVEQQIGRAHV